MIYKIRTLKFIYFSDTDYHIVLTLQCPKCNRYNKLVIDSGQARLSFDFQQICRYCGNQFITDYKKIKNEVNEQIKKHKMVKTDMKKSLDIPNGEHEFVIESSEERITEYMGKNVSYINFDLTVMTVLDEDDKPVNMRVGFPNNLTMKSQYGKFIAEMGFGVVIGDEFDSEELNGLCFTAYVKNVKKGDNEYAEIKKDTITFKAKAKAKAKG